MTRRKTHCIRGHSSWAEDRRGRRYCVDCNRTGNKSGRPKVTHCKRGHEIAVFGRYTDGSCRGCLLVDKTLGYRPVAMPPGAVPIAPLLALIERRQLSVREVGEVVAGVTGLQAKSVERMLHRASTSGYASVRAADDFCVGLGMHPAEVYGPEWFTYGTEVASAV